MNKVTLQIPMTRNLRDAAETVALDYGFSSLQETIRVILNKLAQRKLSISIEENVEYLEPKEDKALVRKYNLFKAEKAKGRTFIATSAKQMIKQLTS